MSRFNVTPHSQIPSDQYNDVRTQDHCRIAIEHLQVAIEYLTNVRSTKDLSPLRQAVSSLERAQSYIDWEGDPPINTTV